MSEDGSVHFFVDDDGGRHTDVESVNFMEESRSSLHPNASPRDGRRFAFGRSATPLRSSPQPNELPPPYMTSSRAPTPLRSPHQQQPQLTKSPKSPPHVARPAGLKDADVARAQSPPTMMSETAPPAQPQQQQQSVTSGATGPQPPPPPPARSVASLGGSPRVVVLRPNATPSSAGEIFRDVLSGGGAGGRSGIVAGTSIRPSSKQAAPRRVSGVVPTVASAHRFFYATTPPAPPGLSSAAAPTHNVADLRTFNHRQRLDLLELERRVACERFGGAPSLGPGSVGAAASHRAADGQDSPLDSPPENRADRQRSASTGFTGSGKQSTHIRHSARSAAKRDSYITQAAQTPSSASPPTLPTRLDSSGFARWRAAFGDTARDMNVFLPPAVMITMARCIDASELNRFVPRPMFFTNGAALTSAQHRRFLQEVARRAFDGDAPATQPDVDDVARLSPPPTRCLMCGECGARVRSGLPPSRVRMATLRRLFERLLPHFNWAKAPRAIAEAISASGVARASCAAPTLLLGRPVGDEAMAAAHLASSHERVVSAADLIQAQRVLDVFLTDHAAVGALCALCRHDVQLLHSSVLPILVDAPLPEWSFSSFALVLHGAARESSALAQDLERLI